MHNRSKRRKTFSKYLSMLLVLLAAVAMFSATGEAETQGEPPDSSAYEQGREHIGTEERADYLDTLSVNPDADTQEGEITIRYYFYSRCLSCDEEATIKENILGMVKKDFPNVVADLQIYNVAEEENLEALKQEFAEHGISEENLMLHPIVFIGDEVMMGSQELGDRFQYAVSNTLKASRKAASNQVTVKYLYADGCTECEKAEEFLNGVAEIQVQNADGQIETKPFHVEAVNAGNIADIERINALYHQYGVKPEEQRVPIVLYDGGYLVGYDNISKNLVQVLENGSEGGGISRESGQMSAADVFWVALSGFIGGLSPCSMSLVLLLFSLLAADKRRVLKAGFGFVVGRIIMYFLMGTVFFGILNAASKAFLSGINTAVTILVCVVGVVFAVLSFIDFYRAKKGQAGKAILQFTPKMKAFYQTYIEKVSAGKALFAAAMVAGAIVAVGEFLCTGQLFAATVLYYFDAGAGNLLLGATVFLLYAVMLSLPAVVVTVLLYKGKQYLEAADRFAGKEYLVKLLMSLLFLGFAALGIYHLVA